MTQSVPATVGAPIDRQSLDQACRGLFDRTRRLVGWGSGSVFDHFHAAFPLRLAYLVDNDARRWGQQAHGVEIVPPERLSNEDPAKTLVVIYSSAWPDIQTQLAACGGPPSLPASAAFCDVAARERLAAADALCARPARRRPSTTDAVVVQGPIVPDVTARVVAAISALHPHARIVLSTWDDADAHELDSVRSWVDEVVVSERPATAGVQNRNLQIVSTRAGIARAVAMGAEWILKTRTDAVVLAPDVFAACRRHVRRYDAAKARAFGQRDRIVVPSTFTREQMRYHPADLVMMGHAADLERFWSLPLDPREGALMDDGRLDSLVADVNMQGHPAESYLGVGFCATLGRAVTPRLRDTWHFYADLFAVVDNNWFDLLWYKNLVVPDEHARTGPRRLVTQAFWERLAAADPRLDEEVAALERHDVTLRAWTQGAAR